MLKIDSQVVYEKEIIFKLFEVYVRDWFELKGFGNGISVSRINAESEDDDSILELDVHNEIYPMLPGEKYRMVISKTLNVDGSPVAGYFPEGKQKSLADKFEYVMHGLLYKISEAKEKTHGGDDVKSMEAYISFGGLQMLLKSDPLKMRKFRIDQRLSKNETVD
ncbi:DNA-directed RNA polymerases II and V subunitA [Sesamum angolense]|uniref:DNA-directed RNA polymerases II and V subunitA n=1 Tax=Sesamum angolense TaxID=2727404 RepID=A0AAE1X6D5_9LAMI|nr:DNA-directed RNA polymerases II and V subunitA [Sesamum angolense]